MRNRVSADAHHPACPASEQPGADAPGGRHAAAIHPDGELVGPATARPAVRRLGVGDPRRVGASESPSAPGRCTAVRVGAPRTISRGPLPRVPPAEWAWPVAPAPVSVRGVAPDPGRAAGASQPLWSATAPGHQPGSLFTAVARGWLVSWYLRSLGDHDTHHGDLRDDGTVVARCGIGFTPRPTLRVAGPPPGRLVIGGFALPGNPPDPDQVCPRCRDEAAR